MKAIKNESLDKGRLNDYARRISNTGVIRRLGFLAEFYGIDGIELKKIEARNYLLLDPGLPAEGKKSGKWRLIVNVREKTMEGVE